MQQSALAEPTFITVQGRPKLVMMSLDEFDRLRGRRHTVLEAVELSEDILSEMRRITDEHPVAEADLVILGGLLDEDSRSVAPEHR